LILRANGVAVSGSDRALDQGRSADKFDYLKGQGITLFPQDGSGITRAEQIVVASTAVEDTVPDIKAARAVGAKVMVRAELLAELFNAARVRVGVAGTSGKSTTTGMIAWILHALGRNPTVMNGAVMTNFARPDALFTSALVGKGDAFVAEVDESDGSIARYRPSVAVVNNISLDHKSMEELRALFRDFVKKADVAVLNLDNEETLALVDQGALTYSAHDGDAHLYAAKITPAADGIRFDVRERGGDTLHVQLTVPGRHNVMNALAALGAAKAIGIPTADAAAALAGFKGVRRRLETVGTAAGVTVIDDFAHNPDKIAATLSTLHDFPGRLLVMFQPHGFRPLQVMRGPFVDSFVANLAKDDVLVMPEPVYYGGTTERAVSSIDIANAVRAKGRNAQAFAERAQCGDRLIELAEPGDRIVIMGARDDTLTTFARELLARLEKRA
jgi:UDP-N-acetylmuramate--alanine ligase